MSNCNELFAHIAVGIILAAAYLGVVWLLVRAVRAAWVNLFRMLRRR